MLRNPAIVAEAKRLAVLEVIKRTGYTPDILGVSLRKSKTCNLVAIIPDVISAFNYPVIRAIESMAPQMAIRSCSVTPGSWRAVKFIRGHVSLASGRWHFIILFALAV